MHRATEQIAALAPPGEAFILVDDELWGDYWQGGGPAGRRDVRWLTRAGRYGGAPSVDEDAIQELERLKHAGARFIFFAWPSFGWLESRARLHRHLRSSHRLVLENDLLIAFDLHES
jgi:hypothetical protein